MKEIAVPVNLDDEATLIGLVQSCIGTKFIAKWADLACKMAIGAVRTVQMGGGASAVEIDTKRYAKVEKLPGGTMEESKVLDGVMFNKDVTHPRMKRRIENPRILLLDCNLEYKKGESQTNIEMMKEDDFSKLLELEEDYIRKVCADIVQHKPDLVVTEKGVSDLAQHYLMKAGVSVIRRLRKTDNLRLAKAVGATIVNRTEEISDSDIGTGAGLFEVRKVGDEYFTFVEGCKNPKACTILLRGASKDVLNEVERNLQDAIHVARNIHLNPSLVYGGGAVEMAVAHRLLLKAKDLRGGTGGVAQWPYRAAASALEVIPRTLAQNCGTNPIRVLTALRAKHANSEQDFRSWGVNGHTGQVEDMKTVGILEPLEVKMQTYKTAIETAILLLRIDDIVSGMKKKGDEGGAGGPTAQSTME